MSNGRMTEAELRALLAAPDEDKWRYLITCTQETRGAVEDIPMTIAEAINHQRHRDFRAVLTIAAVVATLVSSAVMTLLHFI